MPKLFADNLDYLLQVSKVCMYVELHVTFYNMMYVYKTLILVLLDAIAFSRAALGQGTGQIWLDNVRCTGTEGRLINCPANPIGNHNCVHSEDAGVRCASMPRTRIWEL